MSYTYLDHVNTEFLTDEEKVGEAADAMLRDFFQSRIATKSRAIQGDDLRYVVIENGEHPEIIEEEGEWQNGNYSVTDENEYERIYEENSGDVEKEEITASEAAEHFGTADI